MNITTTSDITVTFGDLTFYACRLRRSQAAVAHIAKLMDLLATNGFTVRSGGRQAGRSGHYGAYIYPAGYTGDNSHKTAAQSFKVPYMSGTWFRSQTAEAESVAGLLERACERMGLIA